MSILRDGRGYSSCQYNLGLSLDKLRRRTEAQVAS